jgi:hypothetical protein
MSQRDTSLVQGADLETDALLSRQFLMMSRSLSLEGMTSLLTAGGTARAARHVGGYCERHGVDRCSLFKGRV